MEAAMAWSLKFRMNRLVYSWITVHRILTNNPHYYDSKHQAAQDTDLVANATFWHFTWPCHRLSRVQYCVATAAKARSESGLMGACVSVQSETAASATAAGEGVAVAHSDCSALASAQRAKTAVQTESMTIHFFLAAACK